MWRVVLALCAGMLPMAAMHAASDDVVTDVVLGVHGGTGMDKKDITPELDRQYRAALTGSPAATR